MFSKKPKKNEIGRASHRKQHGFGEKRVYFNPTNKKICSLTKGADFLFKRFLQLEIEVNKHICTYVFCSEMETRCFWFSNLSPFFQLIRKWIPHF